MATFSCTRTVACLAYAVLLTTSATTYADMMDKGMMGKGMMGQMPCDNMQGMDQNNDGMISKQEFTAFHEKMWANMQKNDHGMVVPKQAPMQPTAPASDQGMGGMQDDM